MKPLVLVLVLAVTACTAPQDVRPPPFVPDGQEPARSEAPYAGPYGYGIGSVTYNFAFYGFPRGASDAGTLDVIQLGDFYNPTGTGVFPEGSVHGAGRPLPLALVLDRGAVWCEPCNREAATELPARHAQYAPRGEFLFALDDGTVVGTPPTRAELTAWVSRYAVDYPAVLNPASSLSAIVGDDAYPGHVIVRTRDMKIITWSSGIANAAFWELFEATIAGKKVLPED